MTGRALLLLSALVAGLALVGSAVGSERHPTLSELEGEVMCPTCHTTLSQSNSAVADRIRAFIRERIAAGDTKSEIKDALVAEFGEQVLASPPRRGFNLLAWVLPPAGLVLGAAVLAVLAVRWSRGRTGHGRRSPPATLAPDLERRVDEELARFDR